MEYFKKAFLLKDIKQEQKKAGRKSRNSALFSNREVEILKWDFMYVAIVVNINDWSRGMLLYPAVLVCLYTKLTQMTKSMRKKLIYERNIKYHQAQALVV